MKLLCGFLALLLGALAWSAQLSVAEKAVSDLEYQWAEAQRLGKADVVGPMLADTLTNTDVNGETYGKSQLLSNLRGGKWEVNGINDVKVKVYGDAAVATGSWKGKGVDGDGTRVDRTERWTDTWVKMPKGDWQCVASQQTTSKK
jgi:ketosteroid isomerase-like protein